MTESERATVATRTLEFTWHGIPLSVLEQAWQEWNKSGDRRGDSRADAFASGFAAGIAHARKTPTEPIATSNDASHADRAGE